MRGRGSEDARAPFGRLRAGGPSRSRERLRQVASAVPRGQIEGMSPEDDAPPIDEFHRHEVLHVAAIVADFFDRHLLGAPAVQASPVLLAKAEAIGDLLGDFYQAAAQSQIDDSGD